MTTFINVTQITKDTEYGISLEQNVYNSKITPFVFLFLSKLVIVLTFVHYYFTRIIICYIVYLII